MNYYILYSIVNTIFQVETTTVEFRFFEPPREMEIGSKNREFEKSKVASSQTYFTVVWFYKIQEGRQQRYITLVNVWTIFIYQQNVHLKQNENLRI